MGTPARVTAAEAVVSHVGDELAPDRDAIGPGDVVPGVGRGHDRRGDPPSG
jgi:hypothetical protein